MNRGQLEYNRVSRFVTEIPDYLIDREGDPADKFLFDGGESIDDDDDIDVQTGTIFKKKMDFSKGSGTGYSAYSGTSAAVARPVAKAKPVKSIARAVPKDKPFIASAASAHKGASLGKSGLAGLSKGVPAGTKPDYNVGDRVRHVKFGDGKVLDIVKEPRDYKVTIDFDDYGTKIMFAAFAKLEKI